jgi:hypothetical protein
MTIVFLVSLLRIKRLIKELRKQDSYKSNNCLLNLNLISFAFEALVFAVLGVLAFFDDRAKEDSDFTTRECRFIMSFDIAYYFLWVAFLMRTLITTYMNTKFSCSIQKTNNKFYYVFNENSSNLQ